MCMYVYDLSHRFMKLLPCSYIHIQIQIHIHTCIHEHMRITQAKDDELQQKESLLQAAVNERDAVQGQCVKLAEELALLQNNAGASDEIGEELARTKQVVAEQSVRIEAYEKKLMSNAEQLAKVGFYTCICVCMYVCCVCMRIEAHEEKLMSNAEQLAKVGFYTCICVKCMYVCMCMYAN
jgi:hypothetical protein